ncbi:MAG: S-layer homology domain-containing protein [Desertifilum sp. SIO1I2]|nr:S-layer homology domain-containing protein [Desertifilum sp. SIO1I2]
MKRPVLFAVVASLAASLTACANSPLGQTAERSLAADPRLENNPALFAPNPTQAELPADFPSEIPRYPNAQLQTVSPLAEGEPGQLTRWTTPDSAAQIEQFYQAQFQANNWELVEAAPDSEPNTLAARRDDLQVKVSWETAQAGENAPTEFVLKYLEGEPQAVVSPAPSPSPQPQNPAVANETPEQLRQYVQDLTALGIFNNETIQPNEAMTRRQYARWLVAANNRFYANSPGRQIRLAAATSEAVFQDVPRSDRDFAIIQGLAEAGLIPSALSGEATAVAFRPDAPLTREQLVLWKVPLDTRQALPTATVEAVQERWGFQDASRINARALRAVLADFANGEQSNIRRTFGYTTLFQPQKTVTQAEAAAALWHFGIQGEGLSAADVQSLDRPSVTQTN